MSSEHRFNANLNIQQEATWLNVADKTIKNYIDKGHLKAEKWIGSWRIHYKNILEIHYKENEKNETISSRETSDRVVCEDLT